MRLARFQVDRDIAAAGAIPPLVECLRARGDDRAWTAAMTLQSLSCHSEVRKAAIMAAGGVQLFQALLVSGEPDDKEVAAMCLHNLCYCDEDKQLPDAVERQRAIVEAGAVAPLLALTRSLEDGAREAGACALNGLIHDEDDLRERVVSELLNNHGVPPLVALLRSPSASAEGKHDVAAILKEVAQHDPDAAVARELGFENPGAVGDDQARVATLHEMV